MYIFITFGASQPILSMSKAIYAKNLKYLLKKSRLTEDQFINKLKVERTTAFKWFRGYSYPRPEIMSDICDLLGYRDWYLMMNVDLEKQKIKLHPGPLPAYIMQALKAIRETVDDALAK